MKHLFYIHSYVTYLVALGVIEHRKIDDDDVVMLFARGNIPQSRFLFVNIDTEFPGLWGLPAYGNRFLYIKKRREIKKLDSLIQKMCKGDYICYLPTDSHYLQQLLGTHKSCARVDYIEEGLFSYNDEFHKKVLPFHGKFSRIKRYFNTGYRNINPLYVEQNAILYTLFDKKYYSGSFKKECVMPNLKNLQYSGITLRNSSLLIMNAFRDAQENVVGEVLSVLNRFAVDCKQLNKKVYIKHHPYASKSFMNQVENIFRKNDIVCNVLDNSVNTELLLFNSTGINIYGFFSAAMMYGGLFGHKSYSFIEGFKSSSVDCVNYLNNNFHIPEIFFKIVKPYNYVN